MLNTARVVYPESDGLPMAENSIQYDWISLLKWNIEVLFQARDDVFIAGDNFIYPVEGNNKVVLAPDVYVAFGRPKGPRGSYRVWEEGKIFPQVIFEVLSPSNRPSEMEKKKDFYSRHGAEEYYVLKPEDPMFLEGWRRAGDRLELIPYDDMIDFVSPLLGVRFVSRDQTVQVFGPDGKLWDTPLAMLMEANSLVEGAESRAEEAEEKADRAQAQRDQAQAQRDQAQAQRDQAQAQRDQAQAQRDQAQAQRDQAQAERDDAIAKAQLLAERLRTAGIDPDGS